MRGVTGEAVQSTAGATGRRLASLAMAEEAPHKGFAVALDAKLLVTPAVAADRLSISRSKLYELLNKGILRSVKLGTCRRIPVDGLVELIDRQSEGGPA